MEHLCCVSTTLFNYIMKKSIKNKAGSSRLKQTEELKTVPEKRLSYFKIGDNIRKYRKAKNLKLQELAALIDISSPMLSKIENGRMIPTIPTLFAIINSLGLSVEGFFAELNGKEDFPGYIFIPQSDYIPYVKEENITGFDYYSILEHGMESGSFQISLLHISPKSKRSAVVTAAHEYIYLINGSVQYSLGDNVFEMKTGDSLFFDGRIKHVPINESKTMAIMLVVYFFHENK